MSNRTFALLIGGVLLAFGLIVTAINYGWFQGKKPTAKAKQSDRAKTTGDPQGSKQEVSPGPDYEKSGGIWRKKTDAESLLETPPHVEHQWTSKIGKTPTVAKAMNSATESVAKAIRNNNHPERLTSFIRPDQFDLEEYKADPEKYLNDVEPGRIYQTQQPADDVVPIKRDSDFAYELIQGESVSLRARVQPEMPVTFYATLGVFDNSLKIITVQANENGIAEANFTANEGT